MIYTAAFKVDRLDISMFDNIKQECDIEYPACTSEVHTNSALNDEYYNIHHDTSLPKHPTLSIGSSVG